MVVCVDLGIGFVFKLFYDKVNWLLLFGVCGVGMDVGLCILVDVCDVVGCLVIIDVYEFV